LVRIGLIAGSIVVNEEAERTRAGGSTTRSLGPPVVAAFLAAAVADVLSGDQLVHGGALLLVATALGWDLLRGRDEAGEPADTNRPAARLLRSRWIAPVGIAYAVAAGEFGRYTWPATVAILAPAVAAVAIAWRGPVRERPDVGAVGRGGALLWVGLFVALALWELLALLLQPSLTVSSQAHPTLSTLMDTALAAHTGRSLFLAVWLAGLWLLVER
jgi:hypothetical protein